MAMTDQPKDYSKVEEKLRIKTDTDGKNATFYVRDEDHTLGNALRYIISQNPLVDFAAYSIPHPSESLLNLRIQTYDSQAIPVLKTSISHLSQTCDHILEIFNQDLMQFNAEQNNMDI